MFRSIRIICLIVLILSLGFSFSGCSKYPTMTSPQTMEPAKPNKAKTSVEKEHLRITVSGTPSPEYAVGTGDVLEIKVWDHPDLGGTTIVSQDGRLSFPLIGHIMVKNKTMAQIEGVLEKKLKAGYIVNPQVSVTVKEFNSRKVYVIGEVREPATISLVAPTNVLEVISRAGGVTQEAGTEILIIRPRTDDGRKGPLTPEEAKEGEAIRLDLQSIQQGDISQNFQVFNRDTIFIPKAKYIYVVGEVQKPGRMKLESGMTALKAITVAGGVTEKGTASRLKVIREQEGVREEKPIDLNGLLFPDDVVVVPQSYF